MKNNFFNLPVANIHSKPTSKSEVVSQILYGDKFKILFQKKNWLKIKTYYDRYEGFIKKENFYNKFKPLKKIYSLKTKIYKKVRGKFETTNKFLYFGTGISIKNTEKKFLEFENNKWIKIRDTKNISHIEKNFIKIISQFLNIKYLWGGKTSEGIDCSALIQIFFYYNRIFFPRDSKDQIKFCKKKNNKKFIVGDIIFWKGHVGICINSFKFIHAYGPKKRVLIMPINFAIKLIKKTAQLDIKKISNIKNY